MRWGETTSDKMVNKLEIVGSVREYSWVLPCVTRGCSDMKMIDQIEQIMIKICQSNTKRHYVNTFQ